MTEIYKGKVIELSLEKALLPTGKEIELEVVRHPGAGAVVPLRENGNILLVRQFRNAVGGYLCEIPAGKLEPGENPEAGAARELEEETGWRAARLTPLVSVFTSPGFCNERIHLFLGEGLSPGTQSLGEDEVLEVIEMSLSDAVQKIFEGIIHDAKSIVGILAAAHIVRRRA